MRRNWLTVFIFALAMAVQVLAPAAMNVAMADGSMATGVKAGAPVELCLSSGKSDDSQKAPAQSHFQFCALCQIASDGAAPLAAPPLTVSKVTTPAVLISWSSSAMALPVPNPDFARQARAPPANS